MCDLPYDGVGSGICVSGKTKDTQEPLTMSKYLEFSYRTLLMNLFQNYIEKFYCALRSAKIRKECTPQRYTFPKDHFNNLLDLT